MAGLEIVLEDEGMSTESDNKMVQNETIYDKGLSPSEYFSIVKERKVQCTDELLTEVYNNCLDLLNKYNITGQKEAMRKLIFHLENIEREREVLKLGVDTFVYKEDIVQFIRSVQDRVVKVIELERYEREIPDDIVSVVEKTKDIFTNMYVVYTDYTGEEEKKVEMHRRVKDPILFGSFQNKEDMAIVERFYFLGDWEDEYCDLTLDRMVAIVKENTNKNIRMEISTPKDIQELKEQLSNVRKVDNTYVQAEKKGKVFRLPWGKK